MGEVGRKTAEQLDWAIIATQVLSLYRRLLGHRAESGSGTP